MALKLLPIFRYEETPPTSPATALHVFLSVMSVILKIMSLLLKDAS